MRKFIVLTTVFIATLAITYFTSCNNSNPDTTAGENKSDSLKKVIEKGEYLARHVAGCLDCHSKRDFTKYSGPVMPGSEGGGGEVFDEKVGLPGMIQARNITPDSSTGIGTWTDDEILRAITQGISKNGDTLFPIMPYVNFNRMAKDDLLSIIAFIRTLKPISNKVAPRQLMMPIAMAYPGPMLQPSVDNNVRPAETDKVKYGEYLVNAADCATCHSPLGPQGPDMSRMFQGGYPFDLVTHEVVSANITPDSTTGIGTWTEAMFLDKFIKYREPASYAFDAGTQNTIMPVSEMAGMKDDDLKAIYAYLRTVKPVKNKVDKFPK